MVNRCQTTCVIWSKGNDVTNKTDWSKPHRNKVVRQGVTVPEAKAFRREAKMMAKRIARGQTKPGAPVRVYTREEIAEFERNRS